MNTQAYDKDLIQIFAFTFLAFMVMLITLFVFIYYSRKKITQQLLKNKELELRKQKAVMAATITAQEKERARIARDLHDEIGSKITVISMNLHLLEMDNSPEKNQEIVQDTKMACAYLLESTRNISHNLIPPLLDQIGIHAAILELCDEISMASKIDIIYDNEYESEVFESLSSDNKIHLYRIIQELVNNSLKHGNASVINIKFEKLGNICVFEYADNGIGLKTKKFNANKGIGMRNIISRAEMFGMNCEFDMELKSGFKFTLHY